MKTFCDRVWAFVVLTLWTTSPRPKEDLHVKRTSLTPQQQQLVQPRRLLCYSGGTGEKTAERNLTEKCQRLGENGATQRLLPVLVGGTWFENLSADLNVVFSPR